MLNNLTFYLKSHNIIKSPGQCLIKRQCIPVEWQRYIMKTNGADDLFLWILLLEKSYKFASLLIANLYDFTLRKIV